MNEYLAHDINAAWLDMNADPPCGCEQGPIEMSIVIKADDEAKVRLAEAEAAVQRSRALALEEQVASLQTKVAESLRCRVAKKLRAQLTEARVEAEAHESLRVEAMQVLYEQQQQISTQQQQVDTLQISLTVTSKELDRAMDNELQIVEFAEKLCELAERISQLAERASKLAKRAMGLCVLVQFAVLCYVICLKANLASTNAELSEWNGTHCQLADVQTHVSMLDARLAHAARLEGGLSLD